MNEEKKKLKNLDRVPAPEITEVRFYKLSAEEAKKIKADLFGESISTSVYYDSEEKR